MIRVYIVCHSVSIFSTHCSEAKRYYSDLRIFTAIVSGVGIFGFLRYLPILLGMKRREIYCIFYPNFICYRNLLHSKFISYDGSVITISVGEQEEIHTCN